jgi:hypothetical protein
LFEGLATVEQLNPADLYSTLEASPLQGRISARAVQADVDSSDPAASKIVFDANLQAAGSKRDSRALRIQTLAASGQWQAEEVIVLTPFRAQRALIRQRLRARGLPEDAGRFVGQIAPVTLPDGTVVELDEGVRRGGSLEKLAGLKPARYAEGNAVNSTLRQLGGALGVALVLALAGKPGAGVADFRVVYALLALAGLVIAALAPGETHAAATGRAVR